MSPAYRSGCSGSTPGRSVFMNGRSDTTRAGFWPKPSSRPTAGLFLLASSIDYNSLDSPARKRVQGRIVRAQTGSSDGRRMDMGRRDVFRNSPSPFAFLGPAFQPDRLGSHSHRFGTHATQPSGSLGHTEKARTRRRRGPIPQRNPLTKSLEWNRVERIEYGPMEWHRKKRTSPPGLWGGTAYIRFIARTDLESIRVTGF